MKPEEARVYRRVEELAQEYSQGGFSVSRPASGADLPPFLRSSGYLPDLIATSPKENHVVEVKTRETIGMLERLAPISELVNAQPNWQFVLVLTNPRQEPLPPPDGASLERARELLRKVWELGSRDESRTEASFFFACAALENVLRKLRELEGTSEPVRSPWALVRSAATEGYIAREDALRLRELLRKRSLLVHGASAPSPRSEDVKFIRRLVEGILAGMEGGVPREYRRRSGSDTWHFCANCSSWPTSDYEESASATGELCNECRVKRHAGQCA